MATGERHEHQAVKSRRESVREDPQRDPAVEQGVGGLPDLPHAALTEKGGDCVVADSGGNAYTHLWSIDPALRRTHSMRGGPPPDRFARRVEREHRQPGWGRRRGRQSRQPRSPPLPRVDWSMLWPTPSSHRELITYPLARPRGASCRFGALPPRPLWRFLSHHLGGVYARWAASSSWRGPAMPRFPLALPSLCLPDRLRCGVELALVGSSSFTPSSAARTS